MLQKHRYFCKYTVLPLDWRPSNTNSIDKNTNTIYCDANKIDANTPIFLKTQRFFCKYTVFPLDWRPPNTNSIDKKTYTIDEDANTIDA